MRTWTWVIFPERRPFKLEAAPIKSILTIPFSLSTFLYWGNQQLVSGAWLCNSSLTILFRSDLDKLISYLANLKFFIYLRFENLYWLFFNIVNILKIYEYLDIFMKNIFIRLYLSVLIYRKIHYFSLNFWKFLFFIYGWFLFQIINSFFFRIFNILRIVIKKERTFSIG